MLQDRCVCAFFENKRPVCLSACEAIWVGEYITNKDTLAERLRRRPAKPMGSPRVGSNPTGVVLEMESQAPIFGRFDYIRTL